ncbi:hypothetical protein SAMN05920897_1425 [Alkalispirochaeta americana]|uniref:Uncharacterized protein n=1 Tax=Alkalispirochaeta americana TaxID=159291 RepID=A0A1N6Y7R6_9SPIO|nr:hypothetical protein [Alkalispirochaeta americana]SIR10675.1 hypothetical protein SAMN05920897_1425 [Alkalispirochaeta americana]
MKEEEIVKEILIEVGNRYKGNFSFSIDYSLNGIVSEARNLLYQRYPMNTNANMIFESIIRYLLLDISGCSKSKFEEKNISKLLTKMNE